MKNLIIVTGGAGFVGSNLIKSLLKKTNKKIISLDNYSSGNKKNHVKHKRVKYIKAETIDISKHLKKMRPFLGKGDFVSGEWGHTLVDELKPADIIIEKVAYSAFYMTRLEWILRKANINYFKSIYLI